jgi:hypothetical protein
MIVSFINLLIYVAVIGLILAVVLWAIDALPVPPPLNRIIRVVAIVIAALLVILMLLQLVGVVVPAAPPILRP